MAEGVMRMFYLVASIIHISNLLGQNFSSISNGGSSQIGNEFSLNNRLYAYTTIGLDKKKKEMEYDLNIIQASKPKKIVFHKSKFRFLGFVKDSIILGLNDDNKIYTYNTKKKGIGKKYEFTLLDETYDSFKFRLYKNQLFYLKGDSINVYNLISSRNSLVLTLEELKSQYQDIISFDVLADTIALCLKVVDSTDISYHFCTYNSVTKKLTVVKKGEVTDSKSYVPMARFSQYGEIVYSYYSNNHTYLHFVNYKTNVERAVQDLHDYKIINFSLSGYGTEYLSLFSEEEREKFAKENFKKLGFGGVLLGGCHVYHVFR